MSTASTASPRFPVGPRAGLLLSLAFCTACSVLRREPPGPLLGVEIDHYPGTVLTGPAVPGSDAVVEDDDAERAFDVESLGAETWAVEFRLAYVQDGPPVEGLPISSVARHVFVERSGEPLRSHGALAVAVRLLDGAPQRPLDTWEMRELAPLWAGTTAVCRTARRTGMDEAARWDELDIEVSRRAEDDLVELALVLDGMVVPRVEVERGVDESEELPPAPEPVRERQHLVLDAELERDGAPVTFYVPLDIEHAPDGGFLLEVALADADDADPRLADALARGRTRVEDAAQRARDRTRGLTPVESFRFEKNTAFAALEQRGLERSTLVFLADATDTRLVGDLALVASDEQLSDCAAIARAELEEAGAGPGSANRVDARTFGWMLERASYRWLALEAERNEEGLAPELDSILLRRAGALGRYPDLVLETALACEGVEALEERFLAENRILLEDSHPAVRVRAYDWLDARGAAPPGFDPLEPRDARRAALAAFQSAEEAAAAEAAADGPEPEEAP